MSTILTNEKWDKRFIAMAAVVADWSKDTSTQFGCVIVGPDREIRSTGYNGMPRNIMDGVPERMERPTKYFYAEHSERNAIYNAARIGTPLQDCTLYVTSKPLKFPTCADCARAIIQSGIIRVVQESPNGDYARWKESCDAALKMYQEAGVFYEVLQ